MMLSAVFVVVYVLLSLLVGLCGRRRRMGFVGFLIVSLLITPPLALLVLYLTKETPRPRLSSSSSR